MLYLDLTQASLAFATGLYGARRIIKLPVPNPGEHFSEDSLQKGAHCGCANDNEMPFFSGVRVR
jgi:hypothetical protein